jgi:hypothetical protein
MTHTRCPNIHLLYKFDHIPEWTDMCTRRSNLERYGFMKSSKSERKEIKRKSVTDDSDDENVSMYCILYFWK